MPFANLNPTACVDSNTNSPTLHVRVAQQCALTSRALASATTTTISPRRPPGPLLDPEGFAYCQKNGILYESYGAMKGCRFKDTTMLKMAATHKYPPRPQQEFPLPSPSSISHAVHSHASIVWSAASRCPRCASGGSCKWARSLRLEPEQTRPRHGGTRPRISTSLRSTSPSMRWTTSAVSPVSSAAVRGISPILVARAAIDSAVHTHGPVLAPLLALLVCGLRLAQCCFPGTPSSVRIRHVDAMYPPRGVGVALY
jgi:hypothetical protein